MAKNGKWLAYYQPHRLTVWSRNGFAIAWHRRAYGRDETARELAVIERITIRGLAAPRDAV
jgi:hypothetical protein